MELGWVDFSATDRNKVLDVLDLLSEQGTLDELGIASIRDSFSEFFFPGTSTIQTRAKYFFIVPYIFKDLELSDNSEYLKLKQEFDDAEESRGYDLLQQSSDKRGIVGKNAIRDGSWVQRTPANIYWSGLRKYGIVKYNFSVDDCINAIAYQKNKKKENKSIGNISNKNDGIGDDKFLNNGGNLYFLNIPDFNKDWKDDLDINLTYEEGQFLKNQIISTCGDSMLAYILKENLYEVIEYDSFSDLQFIIDKFPEDIQTKYFKALNFSEFLYVLRVIYNIIVSDGKNEKANNELSILLNDLKEISKIDILDILSMFEIEDIKLENFLVESRNLMENEDIEGLKKLIKNREISLKGINRAKSSHPGEFDSELWFGGPRLDYRFNNAKNIIKDIHESENITEVNDNVES